jgi:TatD DNase family protein
MPVPMPTPPTSPLIDSHCHLDFDEYGADRGAVLERARAAGIVAMVCIGSGRDLGPARAAVALAAAEPDIYATVGVHPHDVKGMTEEDWGELETLARAPRVVGIGETGLDYHYDHSPRDLQRAAFRRFLRLAHRATLPVVCHIRDAHEDAATILREEGIPARGGVIHCFTGTAAEARPYLALGLYLSFSGILTFKKAADIHAAAVLAPIGRIMVETDAPYLAPIPYRGRRNEPSYVIETARQLAALKELPFEAVAAATTANARALFGLADVDPDATSGSILRA